MKDQRTAEILDAYLTCVARFGLEGATQDRIAAEAGVKRPLLRHYLGNKDQMVIELTHHVVQRYREAVDRLKQVAHAVQSPTELVDLLFHDEGPHDQRVGLAWQTLATSVPENPALGQPLIDSQAYFLTTLTDVLKRVAPKTSDVQIRAVAQGIAAIFLSQDSLTPLSPPPVWVTEHKQSALMLAQILETQTQAQEPAL
jgi:AcrR family transcriptional regulator